MENLYIKSTISEDTLIKIEKLDSFFKKILMHVNLKKLNRLIFLFNSIIIYVYTDHIILNKIINFILFYSFKTYNARQLKFAVR